MAQRKKRILKIKIILFQPAQGNYSICRSFIHFIKFKFYSVHEFHFRKFENGMSEWVQALVSSLLASFHLRFTNAAISSTSRLQISSRATNLFTAFILFIPKIKFAFRLKFKK